jgi:hypothetical protein
MGALVGIAFGAYEASPAAAVTMDPFRLLAGTTGGCHNWRDDAAIWPRRDGNGDGSDDPFSYWWSGHPRAWNLPSANRCWHNDEDTASGNLSRPGVDYQGGPGTDVLFATYHVDPVTHWWPGVAFKSTGMGGCRGLRAEVYSPGGVLMAVVNYWHAEPVPGTIGTGWTNHLDVPGFSEAYRQVADIAPTDSNCVIFGAHLHQSADTLHSATPNNTGDVNGDVQFWLWWSL